jgi:hypothetical protein
MSKSIVNAAAAAADLESAPVASDWVLAGSPQARLKLLAKSYDGTAYVVVWECTAGSFKWHYSEDETVVVISGEVFITTEAGKECRLGEGDMGFFPAQSSAVWRIPHRVKKVAIIRKDMPLPLGFGLRAWHKFLRTVSLRGASPLT